MLRKSILVAAAIGTLLVAGCDGTPKPSASAKVETIRLVGEVEAINGRGDEWDVRIDRELYKRASGLTSLTYPWHGNTVTFSRVESLVWTVDFGRNIAGCERTPKDLEFDGKQVITLRAPAMHNPVDFTVECST